ncbi:MAG: hypothetical protein WCS52_11415 [bacterium]
MTKVRLMMVFVAVGVCVAVQCMALDKVQGADKIPAVQGMNENYTIQLQGNYLDCAPLALILTGSGPEFSISLPEPRVTFSATLKSSAGSVEISYRLSFDVLATNGVMRVGLAGPHQQEQEVASVEFRRSEVKGSALVEDGKPVAIVTMNQRKLELTVAKSKAPSSEKK